MWWMNEEEKQELYRTIKEQVRIEEYASRKLHFTVVRKGRYYSLKEHDSVRIDPVKNCFYRNSRPGRGNTAVCSGSIIDFVLEFTNLTISEVMKDLTAEVQGNLGELPRFEIPVKGGEKEKKKGSLELPVQDSHMHNVYAYLIKTRGIDREIVQELVDRRQLYQDQNKNCVFVSYDQDDYKKPVFACRRGTNTFAPFYGDVDGNDYTQGFFLKNAGAEKLYITESVIDALSVMTLRQTARKQFHYLALAGVGKTEAVQRYLKDPDIQEIWIGTDADKWGQESAKKLEEIIRKERPDIRIIMDLPNMPGVKDWNEVLKITKRREQER